MQVLILILIVVAVLVLIGAVLTMRRKRLASGAPSSAPVADTTPVVPGPPPMSDLESALAQVTDSAGRPIRDHIDAETDHVDELRVPDDTGPLLRRALDHVEKPADDGDVADGQPDPPAEH